MSNTAGELGYVVLIPLAAMLFHSLGRHPLAGLAAAFAGVSGGYSANLLIGTVDPLFRDYGNGGANFGPRIHRRPRSKLVLYGRFHLLYCNCWCLGYGKNC
ncbi:AbgT family transporter [Vibrio metschnikovii]